MMQQQQTGARVESSARKKPSPAPRSRRTPYVRRNAEEIDEDRGQRLAFAQERREAFRAYVFDELKLNWVEMARMTGMPSPAILTNFAGGSVYSFSIFTLVKIARVFPRAVEILLDGHQFTGGHLMLAIRHVATLRPMTPEELVRDLITVGAPLTPELRLKGAFGVRVTNPGAERVYPDDTVLVCLPREGKLPKAGRRVVITVSGGPLGEPLTVVREVARDRKLVSLSANDKLPQVIRLSKKPGDQFAADAYSVKIEGLVVMAMIPEG